jgi:hypothetical protein
MCKIKGNDEGTMGHFTERHESPMDTGWYAQFYFEIIEKICWAVAL